MAAGLVDRSGRLLVSVQAATPRPHLNASGDPDRSAAAGAEEVWDALAGVVAEVLAGASVRPEVCGVGSGGPMSAGGDDVSPLNIPAWRAFPLRRRLAELTGLAVLIDNDAKALALGEGWAGAAVGRRNYMSMVVSTGIGGGIVLDGRLLDGASGNAGHVGHLVVVPGGRRCECGAWGCLEAEASGTAIAAITGRPAAEAGPEIVERTGRLVGLAVGNVANLLDLEMVTVAGSVALGFGLPFFEAAADALAATARISFARGCRIEPSPMGTEGPLIGAAAVGRRGAAVGRGDNLEAEQ